MFDKTLVIMVKEMILSFILKKHKNYRL